MRRRGLLGGSLAALGAAAGQAQTPSGRIPRIGYLSAFSQPDPDVDSLRTGLRALGHAEGRTYTLEIRYAERSPERHGALLDELLRADIAVLLLGGPLLRLVGRAAQHVPVVFAMSGDPVEAGIVSSFARPGGNVTGISFLALELVPKRLSLLKEAAPAIRRVGVLSNPQHAGEHNELRVTREAAAALGIEIVYEKIHAPSDLAGAFAAIKRADCDSLTAFPESVTSGAAREIAAFAAEHAMPSVFGWRVFCDAGGLMSYGPTRHDAYARTGYFIDRILKGAKPSDLPVELPRAIELIINQRTARRLGLSLPHVLVSRADEVIE